MDNILQTHGDEYYMRQALREAEKAYELGEVPVGCVIVREGRIVGRGYNQVELLRDPTAHAEILAIGAACQSLENWRLENCTLFVSLEPCPMCAGAILNSRIARVVFGSVDRRLGACGSTMDVLQGNPLHRNVRVEGGLLGDESLHLIRAFFRELREKSKSHELKGFQSEV